MGRKAGAALGLLFLLSAGLASAADQKFVVACGFDATESGADRNGTVADGLGGPGVSLQFDLANSTVRFRDGGMARIRKADADSVVFDEAEYTITFDRSSGDLISHDNKTGFDGTFHCSRSDGPG
ncbi:MAG TPA: hypothetical protein VNU97_02280 [Rhizomicrobium sp.]|jgi:hypothetical protein|nr:hypothetical protein [Rhizomicrobium sp.]